MSTETPRLCILCRHFDGRSRCQRPFRARRSPVYGIVTENLSVRAERERGAEVSLWAGRTQCGVGGRFFNERPPMPPPPSVGPSGKNR